MQAEKLKLNTLSFVILVLYPIFIIALAVAYGFLYGVGAMEIGLAIVAYYGANISVGIGLHRLWAHGTYKTNIIVEAILVFLSAGTLQGPVLAWASDHFKHHTYTDKDGDPHSPSKYKNKFLGFFWSHILWMLLTESSFKHIDKLTMQKLGKKKILVWQLNNYWQIALFMNLIVPLIIGYACGGTLVAAVAGFIFIGLGRAFQQQMTFCVNSLCHIVGQKKYYIGTARDIWWLFFLLLGENWHNFHHAFANDYRNGHKWYHLDIHKWIIFSMEKMGLAWDVVRTSEERIKAKMQLTKESLTKDVLTKLESFEFKASKIRELTRKSQAQLELKFIQAGEAVDELAIKYKTKLQRLEKRTDGFVASIRQTLNEKRELTEAMLDNFKVKLSRLEKLSWNLGLQVSYQ